MTTQQAGVGTAHVGERRVLEVARCGLLVLNGKARGTEATLVSDLFRVGKSRSNELVLSDDTVSRMHCEIVRRPEGFLLRDLGSTNGTLLDGSAIREAWLKPGSVITVGDVELKVRPSSEQVELLPSESHRYGELVGRSLAMREIFGLLERLGGSDATVLIGGETGTGKDVLARSVHAQGPRADRPFIVVDCGAVVGTLIESELFGHEKGAFTGASAAREGAFELADGGTLFLDEIGELPLDLQPKLLRALEQRSFRRVGGNSAIHVNIRIIAASKRNLRMEVERGKFREDLYFRLAVLPIEMPPLRERRDDIPMLVQELLGHLAERERELPAQLSESAMSALMAHDWPGNVRELRNVLERAAYFSAGSGTDEIDLGAVPLTTATTSTEVSLLPEFSEAKSYRDTRAEWEALFEKHYVRWLLERAKGNLSAAARMADMDRKYLYKLARRHGLRE